MANMAEIAGDEFDDFQHHPLFLSSLNPMLIADDERRYVDAKAAACLAARGNVLDRPVVVV